MTNYTPQTGTYTPAPRGCNTLKEVAGRSFYVGHEGVDATVYADGTMVVRVGLRIAYEGTTPSFADDTEFFEWIRQTGEDYASEFPYGTTGVRKGMAVETRGRYVHVTITSNTKNPTPNVGQKAAAAARRAANGAKISRISSGGRNAQTTIFFSYTYAIGNAPETAPQPAPAPEVPAAPVAPETAPETAPVPNPVWTYDVQFPAGTETSALGFWHTTTDGRTTICGVTVSPNPHTIAKLPVEGPSRPCPACLANRLVDTLVAQRDVEEEAHGYLWTPDVPSSVPGQMTRDWHAVEVVPGDEPAPALCGAMVPEDALVYDRIPKNSRPCRKCARLAADAADDANAHPHVADQLNTLAGPTAEELVEPTRVRLLGTVGWGARFGTLLRFLTPTIFHFEYQGERLVAVRGKDGAFYVRNPRPELGPGAVRVDVADEEGTFEGKTAAEWRAVASGHARAEAASFERSEEDGFFSQRVSRQSAREAEIRAELAEFGAYVEREALFDREWNLVKADWRNTRYGYAWMVRLDGGKVEWFRPSEAAKPETRWAADDRKGYHVGRVLVPARVEFRAGGSGMAGAYAGDYVAVRASEEMDYANVMVLDPGYRPIPR